MMTDGICHHYLQILYYISSGMCDLGQSIYQNWNVDHRDIICQRHMTMNHRNLWPLTDRDSSDDRESLPNCST